MCEPAGQADFEEIALALTARSAEEAGTLSYRRFGPDDGTYFVIEQYADTAAALAHNEHSADLLARVEGTAEMVFAELYGTIGPELLAAGAVRWHAALVKSACARSGLPSWIGWRPCRGTSSGPRPARPD